MKRRIEIRGDRGNAFVEGVAFALVGCGLVLSSGLELFALQQKVLELQGIARNSLRAYLLSPGVSFSEQVHKFQAMSSSLRESTVTPEQVCSPDCFSRGSVIVFTLESDGIEAKAFGVISN